jgi:hypothetical protein
MEHARNKGMAAMSAIIICSIVEYNPVAPI